MPKAFVREFDGELLADRRRALEWTQRELAFAARTSLATLQKWESGTARPDPKAARRVADTLGCAVSDLVRLPGDQALPGDLRAWAGHSITTAAAELGMSRGHLAELEDGYREPAPHERESLAALVEVDPSQLDLAWQRARLRLHARLGTSEEEAR